MKEFQLSTRSERIGGISFSAATIICFDILLYALRGQLGLMLFCGVCVLLVTLILGMYVINVLKAKCVVDAEKKTLEIRGFLNYTEDISKAVLLQTVARRNGQNLVRVLVFSDAENQVIATVPTMFTHKQGIWADPMAKEMAQYLGIEFKQNVPDWEFDKEKYKEHQKEVAEQERKEAKERRQKRMEQRMNKRKK